MTIRSFVGGDPGRSAWPSARRLARAASRLTAATPQTQTQTQPQGQPQDGAYVLKVNSNIVLTNVIVRDKKTGAVVKGLKATDFTILENNKPQKVASFDYQNVDEAAVLAEKNTVSGKQSIGDLLDNSMAANPQQLRDHRLIVLFFDLSSMQDEDIDRAVDAAKDYVNKQMQPADLVSLVSMSTGLTLDHDFTSDKAALLKGLIEIQRHRHDRASPTAERARPTARATIPRPLRRTIRNTTA